MKSHEVFRSLLKFVEVPYTIKKGTNCFPYILLNDEFEKLFLLDFLRESVKLEDVKGYMGNTSGCLDVAAFLGHRVLDLRSFNTN